MEFVNLVVRGDVSLWDVESWHIWRHLAKLSTGESNVPIRIFIPEATKEKLPWHILHSLLLKATGREIEVQVCDSSTGIADGCFVAASVVVNGQMTKWGVFDESSLAPGRSWGLGSENWPIIKQSGELEVFEGHRLTLGDVETARPEKVVQQLVSTQLNGTIADVGRKFWDALFEVSNWLNETVSAISPSQISYVDRYIRTPLHARVLYEILQALVEPSKRSAVVLEIQTVSGSSDRRPNYFHDNWSTDRDQSTVLRELFSEFKLNLQVHRRTDALRHARFLTLKWSDGRSVEINLDQGVGFLKSTTRITHNFQLNSLSQAREIKNAKFSVLHDGGDMPVYLVRP